MIAQMVPHVMVAGVHWPVPHRAALMRALRARLSAEGLEPVRARGAPEPFSSEEEFAERLHPFRGLAMVALDRDPPRGAASARDPYLPRAWTWRRALSWLTLEVPVLVLAAAVPRHVDLPLPGVTFQLLDPDAGPEALDSPEVMQAMAGWMEEVRAAPAPETRAARWGHARAIERSRRIRLSWGLGVVERPPGRNVPRTFSYIPERDRFRAQP